MSDLRAAIEEYLPDLHRIGCDCGHATFVHVDGAGCTGGLVICGCMRGALSIVSDRLRAILATPAPDTDATVERVVNQWAHVLDDMGSADFYDTEQEARQMRDLCGGGVDRVETYPVVPFGPALTPTQPAEPTQSDAGEVGA